MPKCARRSSLTAARAGAWAAAVAAMPTSLFCACSPSLGVAWSTPASCVAAKVHNVEIPVARDQ
eukprot:616942-Prymnesium_polylepis.1